MVMLTIARRVPRLIGNGCAGRRPRLTDHVRARLMVTALDRAIAAGAPGDSSSALWLRAQALAQPSVARELGDQLRRIVGEAHEPARRSTRIRGPREHVLAAEDDLRRLASRLQSARPAAVRGVAKVRLLLTDGTGPLYYRGSDRNLGDVVRDATSALC